MKFIKNISGFSVVEGLVGVGLLAALGLGMMKLSDSQKKAMRGQKQVSELPRTMVMIKQLASDKASCEANFKGKDIKSSLTELKDAESKVRFKQGDVIGKGEYRLTDIKLDGYSEDTSRVKLSLSFDKLQEGATSSKVNRFTFIHAEASSGKISKCLDPSEMSSDSLAKRFCKDIDPAQNDDCEDNLSNLMLNVKELYCGKGHPFLKFDEVSGKCLPLDADKACGSGYIQGYDAKGELVCYTPSGSSTPTAPKVCTSWNPWEPSTSGTCSTLTVTQTRSCTSGQIETQTQTVGGTKVCDVNCTSWSNWGPSAADTCSDKTVTQTRSCISGKNETQTQTVTGTKDCSDESCKEWNDWSPVASIVCPDKDVRQTRNCKSGAGQETRVVKGEKKDCDGCSSLGYTWSGARAGNGPHSCSFTVSGDLIGYHGLGMNDGFKDMREGETRTLESMYSKCTDEVAVIVHEGCNVNIKCEKGRLFQVGTPFGNCKR